MYLREGHSSQKDKYFYNYILFSATTISAPLFSNRCLQVPALLVVYTPIGRYPPKREPQKAIIHSGALNPIILIAF
jgi:hypothetical protein